MPTLCPDWRWPDYRCDVFHHHNDGVQPEAPLWRRQRCLFFQRFIGSRQMAAHMPCLLRSSTIRSSDGAEANLENVTSSNGCNLASYRESYIDKRQRDAHADSCASHIKTASCLAKTREGDSQSSK